MVLSSGTTVGGKGGAPAVNLCEIQLERPRGNQTRITYGVWEPP